MEKKNPFDFKEIFKNPFKKTSKNKTRKNCPDTLFTSIISPKNYPFESYIVETEDHHLLKLFRIQAKNTKITNEGKKAVFLQHGLFDSADNWVINGEKILLDFTLLIKDSIYG